MARRMLTDASAIAVVPTSERQEIGDAGCRGLRLVVQPTGAKSWAFRYEFAGKSRKLTLGPLYIGGDEPSTAELDYPLTVSGARKLASDAALTVARGSDPAKAKRTKKQAVRKKQLHAQSDRDTVESLAREFVEKYAKIKTRSWKHTAGTLGLKVDENGRLVRSPSGGDVLSAWGDRSAHEITRRDVNALLDEIVSRGARVKANRVLAAIRKMFSWAVSRDIIAASPCFGVSPPTKETSRDRVLADWELRLVWLASHRLSWPFGPLLRLLILTLQRRDEVTGMRRAEITGQLWTLPKERVKNFREHQLPLAPAVMTLLKTVPVIGSGEYVFTLTGNSPTAGLGGCRDQLDAEILILQKEEALQRGDDPDQVQPLPHWTLHDLRRTGASGMARLGIALPTIEKVLNHTSGSFGGIVSVYQRHTYADEMRNALEKWADFVEALVARPATASVSRLARRPAAASVA